MKAAERLFKNGMWATAAVFFVAIVTNPQMILSEKLFCLAMLFAGITVFGGIIYSIFEE